MTTITIDHGHKNGRPFGFREMKRAMQAVTDGKLEIVRQNRWSMRGPKGGFSHGWETTFREIA